MHRFISEDDCVNCLTCGAHFCDERIADFCIGRTDLVHPANGDASSHSLDNCDAFDATGDCDHLATNHGCDCDRCA